MAREAKLQSKFRLDTLMKNIDHEQKKRQERIISLQLSIKNKEEALQKRMDRVKRQSEIAEAAANENKDQNEINYRQNFMVQKLWCAFLTRKMEHEMKKYYDVE
jgi:Skp family chaperone for outer membrane proteins